MQGLNIDTWYKAMIAAGVAVAAFGGLGKEPAALLIALGLASWGGAAFAGATEQQSFVPATFNSPPMKISRTYFRLTPAAALLGVMSAVLLLVGFTPIVREALGGRFGCAPQKVAPLQSDPKVSDRAAVKPATQK